MKQSYQAHIDGMRAVAILLVVAFHAAPQWIPGGFIGVDIFFVISGFLIHTLIVDNLEQGDFSFLSFYRRRVRRIFPALAVVLASCWLFGRLTLIPDEFRELSWQIVAGAGFTANLLLWAQAGYFDTQALLKPLLHLWSLGIEEQFYLVWPQALWLAWRFRVRLLPLILVGWALSLGAELWIMGDDASGAFYFPHTRIWELLSGSALAQATRRWPRLIAAFAPSAGVGVGVVVRTVGFEIAAVTAFGVIAAAAVILNHASLFPGWRAILPVAAATLLIFVGEHSRIASLCLRNPLMVSIGLISYPLYLWHWPLLSFAHILGIKTPTLLEAGGLVVAAFVLAALTYRLIERPIRAGQASVKATWGAALAVASVGAVAIAGIVFYTPGSIKVTPGSIKVAGMNEAIEAAVRGNRHYLAQGCGEFITDKLNCLVRTEGKKGAIVVWGDSHAHVWMAPIIEAAERHDIRVVEFATAGCPPVLGVRRTEGGQGAACSSPDLAEKVFNVIKRLSPKAIILIARWSLYTRGLVINGQVVENTYVTTATEGLASSESSRDAFARQLPDTLLRLSAIAPLVVFRTMPRLHQPIKVGLERNLDGFEPTFAEHRDWESVTDPLFTHAAEATPRIRVFDPAQLLCRSKCSAVVSGVPMYSDDNHITTLGALMFKESISRIVFDE
ncbi:exopolysaccharide production protein ExoZ [Azospirillaceae bacterium]